MWWTVRSAMTTVTPGVKDTLICPAACSALAALSWAGNVTMTGGAQGSWSAMFLRDPVMLAVDRAGVRGDQDRGRDQVIVERLDGAAGLPVIPGPGVIEGGGEERRVVFGRLFTVGLGAGGLLAVTPGYSRKGER
jgi:hypothetical protein